MFNITLNEKTVIAAYGLVDDANASENTFNLDLAKIFMRSLARDFKGTSGDFSHFDYKPELIGQVGVATLKTIFGDAHEAAHLNEAINSYFADLEHHDADTPVKKILE